MLGLGLAAFGVRRRRLLVGAPVAVLAIAAVACGATLVQARASFDERALDHPTFFARGAELVQLLDAATNARAAGDGYASKVQGAVSGFASLLTDPTAGRVDDTRPALLASDLHNNRVALDSLRDYARDKPVFFVGDFGNTGSADEARLLAPGVAGLGRSVVAVSGNHDSTIFMRSLARRGVTVLTRDGVLRADGSHGGPFADVAGLRVAGFDDPLEWHGGRPGDPRRIFSFSELPDPQQATDAAQQDLLRWYDGLPRPPDVVLVHQNGLAQWLAEQLRIRGVDAAADDPHRPRPPPAHHDARRRHGRGRRDRRRERDLRRRPRLRRPRRPALRAHREPRCGRPHRGRAGLRSRAGAPRRHRPVRGAVRGLPAVPGRSGRHRAARGLTAPLTRSRTRPARSRGRP